MAVTTAMWCDVAPSRPATASWLHTDILAPFWAVLRISKLTQAICTLNPCWENCCVNTGFSCHQESLSSAWHHYHREVTRWHPLAGLTLVLLAPLCSSFPPDIGRNSLNPTNCPSGYRVFLTHGLLPRPSGSYHRVIICGVWVQIIWMLLTITDKAPGYRYGHQLTERLPHPDSWLLEAIPKCN